MSNETSEFFGETDTNITAEINHYGLVVGLYKSYNEYKAAVSIWKYLPPFMIVFGTIGNILSICVLTRKNIRNTNSFLYLIVLAISDTLVLYTGLLRQWLIYLKDLDIRKLSPFLCKTHIFLVYFSLQFSSWLLVLVTYDRVCLTWFPHKFKRKFSVWTPVTLISITAGILIALNSHFLYGYGNNTMLSGNKTIIRSCYKINEDYKNFIQVKWPWIDLAIYCLIPFLLILIGNVLIFLKVFKSRRAAMTKIGPVTPKKLGNVSTIQAEMQRTEPRNGVPRNSDLRMNDSGIFNNGYHSMNEDNVEPLTSNFVRPSNKLSGIKTETVPAKHNKLLSLSRTLITLNTAFLIFNAPISVFLVGQKTWYKHINEKKLALLSLVWVIVNICAYCNNTFNFLLYCLSGTKFRQELRKMFSRK